MKSESRFDQLAVARLVLGFYPSDDDGGDLVHGPGGPRARDPGILQAGTVARFLAREALTRYRITQALGGEKAAAGGISAIRQQLLEDFDAWCGTRPGKWPWPRPRKLAPIDLLVFAAHLQQLALQDGPLQTAYQSVADAGFERGMAMLMQTGRGASVSERVAA